MYKYQGDVDQQSLTEYNTTKTDFQNKAGGQVNRNRTGHRGKKTRTPALNKTQILTK